MKGDTSKYDLDGKYCYCIMKFIGVGFKCQITCNLLQIIINRLIFFKQQIKSSMLDVPAGRNTKASPGPVSNRFTNLQDVELFSNEIFFNSLENYKPMCWLHREGPPFFLKNKQWLNTFICFIVFDLLYAFVIIFMIIQFHKKQSLEGGNSSDKKWLLITNFITFFLLNIFYFFTQFMNPGIRNPAEINQLQFQLKGKEFCARCNQNRTPEMTHCNECAICIQDIDHHCGFFGKCIGGYQKYAFYGFLTVAFIGFICIIGGLTSLIL